MGGWEAKLKTEVLEAEESIAHIKAEYQKQIDEFVVSIHQELHKTFDRIDDDLIPPQTQRVIELEEDVKVYYKKTVPDVIERQSGEVSRQLKKQYETFDIEKQKAQKK